MIQLKILGFLFLVFLSPIYGFSQDIIVKRDGGEIPSKVLEISESDIKYKDFDFLDGPTRSIRTSSVFMIIYENGRRETFNVEEKNEPERSGNYRPDYKGTYFMAGFGYGASYGGLGTRVQGRFGKVIGGGIHAGIGYFPAGQVVLANIGAKFFPYKGLYVDILYGGLGWYDSYDFTSGSSFDQGAITGFAFLTGADWTFGSTIQYGFNAAIGFTRYDYISNDFLDYNGSSEAIFDLGFVIRF